MRRREAGQGDRTASGRIASEAFAEHGQAARTVQAVDAEGHLTACSKSRRFWLDQIDRVSYT